MSADKYPCISSRQIEAIVYLNNPRIKLQKRTWIFNMQQTHFSLIGKVGEAILGKKENLFP